jgi:hypothetical protein
LPGAAVVADRVGFPLSRLFSEPLAENSCRADDLTVLGVCLAGKVGPLSRSRLAGALGWDLERLAAAARHLSWLLEPLGLCVLVGEEHIELRQRPGVVDPSVMGKCDANGPAEPVDAEVAAAIWGALFLGDKLHHVATAALTRGYHQGVLSVGGRTAATASPTPSASA